MPRGSHTAAQPGGTTHEEAGFAPARVSAAPGTVEERATSAVARSRSLASALESEAPARSRPVANGPGETAVRQPAMAQADGANAAPPIVQVTIGRIEVRAVTPSAPPAPRAPARPQGPALSLDEYLRRRNGGGR